MGATGTAAFWARWKASVPQLTEQLTCTTINGEDTTTESFVLRRPLDVVERD
jgi:hypothetical protein